MGSVTVTFVGICTHFRGIAPGVPHRVVLADASALRFGIAMLGDEELTPNHATYYTMPHFPVLRTEPPDVRNRLTIPGVMEKGNIYSGVYLSIRNATNAGMIYEPSFAGIPRIETFVEGYAFSPEVVLGGQAAVYFDLFNATIWGWPDTDGAVEAVAYIETDGAPELLATPFFRGAPQRIPLADHADAEVGLVVANQGMDCETGEASFDFLLHYLTNRNGIPRRFLQRTPGMNPLQTSISRLSLDQGALDLTTFDYPKVFDSPCLTNEGLLAARRRYQPGLGFRMKKDHGDVFITSLACSNSQYP